MVRVVVGLQWGDEGKGKIVDALSCDVDVVVRYQGGENAGHTVIVGDEKIIVHHIPSGIFSCDVICVLGNGMVIDPLSLLEEIESLEAKGINCDGRLWISDRAHIVFPYHKARDIEDEKVLEIGSTRKGIGPAYTDKVARRGIRFCDVFAPNDRVLRVLNENSEVYQAVQRLRKYIADTVVLLNGLWRGGKNILFEGAQATMLDVEFGTYPFVTSSNPTAGYSACGSGLPPVAIDEVIGVAKCYTTRVGNGPFPTEIEDDWLREKGGEYGATTGRPRRCGWFDGVVVKYASMVNGVSKLALTKLDVLDRVDKIPVCIGYRYGSEQLEFPPASSMVMEECEPVYEVLPGWKGSVRGVRSFDDLPTQAKDYVRFIEDFIGIPVGWISVGPGKDEIIQCG